MFYLKPIGEEVDLAIRGQNKYFWNFLVVVVVVGAALGSCTKRVAPEGRVRFSDTIYSKYLFYEGLKSRLFGDNTLALKYYTEAQKYYNSCELNHELYKVGLAVNNYDLAVASLRKAYNECPVNIDITKDYISLLYNTGELDSALFISKSLLSINPATYELLFLNSLIYQQREMYDSTLQNCSKIERLFGKNFDVFQLKIDALIRLGRDSLARSIVTEELPLHSSIPEHHFFAGNYHFQSGNDSLAISRLSSYIEASSYSLQSIVRVLNALSTNGEARVGFNWLKTYYIQSRVSSNDLQFLLNQFFYNGKFTTDNRQDIASLIDLMEVSGVEKLVITDLRYRFYTIIGAAPQLLETLRARKAINALDSLQWLQFLELHLSFGMPDSIISYQPDALKGTEQARVYFLSGVAYQFKGNHQLAIDAFERGTKSLDTKRDSIFTSLYLGLLGDSYFSRGTLKQAYKQYKVALRYNPENHNVLNNYSYYLSIHGGDLGRAKVMSERAVLLQPDNASYLDTYGWILYLLGDYSNSKRYLMEAISKGGGSDPDILEHYGDVLFMTGAVDTAIIYWEKALKANPENVRLQKKVNQKSVNPI
ncbi:MAG: hypothetical protein JW783_06590 [Bacteroidales bacterium]|nr:hypothetical protein [Bacteroidales bacterium]MBN2750047.1 hypothetical protein [Bacteroidales bacterium]